MTLLQDLQWRYATKAYDQKPLPLEKFDYILEAARLSASSFGLQPYKVLVVDSADLRAKIRPVSWNQPQVTDAAKLLVIAAWADIGQSQISALLDNVSRTRNIPRDSLADYGDKIAGFLQAKTEAARTDWAARQSYIMLGNILSAAAEQKVDATPMEGFDPAAVDDILGLAAKNLRSVVMVALGTRAAGDWLAPLPKVRRSRDELVETV